MSLRPGSDTEDAAIEPRDDGKLEERDVVAARRKAIRLAIAPNPLDDPGGDEALDHPAGGIASDVELQPSSSLTRRQEYPRVMPSVTPHQLHDARRRSGRLGGRPRKPTVDEARQAALDELTPKALMVLKAHLGEGDEINPNAWPAALRVFEHAFGRAPEQAAEELALPEVAAQAAALDWRQLRMLARRHDIDLNGSNGHDTATGSS